MKHRYIKHLNINDYIDKSLDSIYTNSKKEAVSLKSSHKKKSKHTENYFDKFKVKLKKRKIESNLTPISLKRKFARGITKNLGNGPVNADGMDSSLTGSVDVGVSAGWGAGDGWGVTAFGEGIALSSSKFIDFVRQLGTDNSTDIINAVCDGYKLIYKNIEAESTAILCGIQPSMREFMNFNIPDFVFAMNNFRGTIVSLYIGEHNSMESENDLKQWYLSLGVEESVIDNIIFIEKVNIENNEFSLIEFELVDIPDEKYYIKSSADLADLCSEIYNPILIGCVDVFFMAELLTEFKKLEKYTQIDKKFIYLI